MELKTITAVKLLEMIRCKDTTIMAILRPRNVTLIFYRCVPF